MRYRLAALALVLSLFALLVLGARRNAITADEPAYIAGGYAWLARGQEALALLPQRGYPPLLPALEALPLYLANPNIPLEQVPGWPDDYETYTLAFKPYLAPLERTELASRMATIWLTVLLGALVFRWGADLLGPLAGLLALAAMVFDPTLLAHGRLAHSDAGSVALGTAALYATWRWSQRPAWRWAVAAGALLGLTLLAKVSGLLWLASAGLIVLATWIWRGRPSAADAPRPAAQAGHDIAQGIAIGATALLMWWAVYGFTWGRLSFTTLPAPAPAYWEGARYLASYVTDVFAFGQRQHGRWWWYFPAAFLIKNPLPSLIGLGIALVTLLRGSLRALRSSRLELDASTRAGGGRPVRPATVVALSAFPLLYSAVAIADGMNIGYRHMLPIHPFLYLAIGCGLACWAWHRPVAQPWRRWVVAGLGLWYAVSVIRVFPWEIAYFNELVGGPSNGYRYLADSNVDWGQADRLRDRYLAANPHVQAAPPAARFHPGPGRYLVGASRLQGTGSDDIYAYEWFRRVEPAANLGYSQLLFDVAGDPAAAREAWLAQCTTPVAPLDQAAVAAGLGGAAPSDLRQVAFDCTQAWSYPGGEGAAAGIYALHHSLLARAKLCLPEFLPCPAEPADPPWIQRRLAAVQARLSFEQPVDGQLPAFALFEAQPAGLAAESSPQTQTSSLSETALDGPLTFLRAVVYETSGDGMEVETWWRVTAGPVSRGFSIMAHLLSPQGEALAVADGLGLSPLALLPGDVIVQRHRFPAAGDLAGLQLRTGAYWLDTLQRWPVIGQPEVDAITVPLAEVLHHP